MKSTRPEHLLRCAVAMARIGAAVTLSTPAVLLGRALFYILVMLILGAFWNIVAAQQGSGMAMLPARLVIYVGVAECITLSVPALQLRLEDDIRSGAIEAYLSRPMPYLFGKIGESIGGLLVRLTVLGLAGLVCLFLSGSAAPPFGAWPLIVVLSVLGGGVNVLMMAAVGLSAFWVRRVQAVWLLVQKLSFLLGGLFAPVTLYPVWLSKLAQGSPFAAGLYWPAMMALPHDNATILWAFVAVLSWIVLLTLLCALLWHAGMRRLLTRGVV